VAATFNPGEFAGSPERNRRTLDLQSRSVNRQFGGEGVFSCSGGLFRLVSSPAIGLLVARATGRDGFGDEYRRLFKVNMAFDHFRERDVRESHAEFGGDHWAVTIRKLTNPPGDDVDEELFAFDDAECLFEEMCLHRSFVFLPTQEVRPRGLLANEPIEQMTNVVFVPGIASNILVRLGVAVNRATEIG